MSIAAVERDSGLPKDTLRAWERRYGFPQPLRDHHGERVYPAEQVATLRLLRRLVDAGHRPGKVVGRPHQELAALLRGLDAPALSPEAQAVLAALAAHDAARLREVLTAAVLRAGLDTFAAAIGPGLTEAVGAAWARGELEIHQEHLFTEQFTAVLRSALSAVHGATAPRVLLATFPQEPHSLGLLMAEAMFVLEDCVCISLGVQSPIAEIAAAARAHKADIVALSFSSMIAAPQAMTGLAEIRALVPERTEIWAGGGCAGLRPQAGIKVLRALTGIAPAVSAWRRHAAASA